MNYGVNFNTVELRMYATHRVKNCITFLYFISIMISLLSVSNFLQGVWRNLMKGTSTYKRLRTTALNDEYVPIPGGIFVYVMTYKTLW